MGSIQVDVTVQSSLFHWICMDSCSEVTTHKEKGLHLHTML